MFINKAFFWLSALKRSLAVIQWFIQRGYGVLILGGSLYINLSPNYD